MSAHSGVRIVALALFVLLPATTFGQSVVGVLGIAAEIAPIEKRLKDSREITVQGYVFREGTLNGRRVVVGRSGAGKVNAAIITTLLIGLLIGAVAKLLMPGKDPGGCIITMLIGLAGSTIGAYLGHALGLYKVGEPAGFIGSVLGAMLLLLVYRMIVGKRS